MKPTARVIEIANTIENPTRKNVIAAAVAEGIKATTASTYYAKWQKQSGVEVKKSNVKDDVFAIASSDPTASRKDVIAKCTAAGITAGSASTFYAAWKRQHKVGGKLKRVATCPTCGRHFSSDGAFDAHRTGEYTDQAPHYGRSCMTDQQMLEIGMVKNEIGAWGMGFKGIN